MQNEELSQESQELYESLNELIDTIKKSSDSKGQINGILSVLKTILEQLRANEESQLYRDEITKIHSNMLNHAVTTSQLQDKSLKAQVQIFTEYDDKIAKLANMVTELATNSAKLAEQIKGIAETSAKIPVIDVDNLLKTLNEHADEINENTASIKAIKNELKL